LYDRLYGDKNNLSINEKKRSAMSTEIETSVLIERGIASTAQKISAYSNSLRIFYHTEQSREIKEKFSK
jgi:hypothetical protein